MGRSHLVLEAVPQIDPSPENGGDGGVRPLT
jgi:hypothetical protein